MPFTVYKIEFNNKPIYIGYTKNLLQRQKQHKYAIKSKPNKLYKFARDNGLKELILIPIKTFKTKTEAKRFECLTILQFHFYNDILLNKVPNISDR